MDHSVQSPQTYNVLQSTQHRWQHTHDSGHYKRVVGIKKSTLPQKADVLCEKLIYGLNCRNLRQEHPIQQAVQSALLFTHEHLRIIKNNYDDDKQSILVHNI